MAQRRLKINRVLLLVMLSLLCGVGLRLALYDVHGLEGDDGVALVLTRYDVPTLVDGLRRQELDVHPPLYFLLLKAWIALTGESLLALRFFNSAAEALTGAFLWALLRHSRSRQAALLALMLWMIAPLLLYGLYAIRMYTLMALWVTMGAYVLARFITRPRVSWGLALGMVCAAALLTHLYGAFLWAAAVFIVGTAILRGRVTGKAALAALMSLGGAALVFLPFGVPMLQRFLSGRSLGAQAGGSIVPWEMPGQLLAAMLTHRALMPSFAGGLLLIAALLGGLVWKMLLIGPYRQRSMQRPANEVFWIIVMVCGAGIAGILALAIGSAVYRPRYAVPFVPLLLGVIAVLLSDFLKKSWRLRMMGAAILLALVLVSFKGVVQNLGRNIYDDWRGAAQFIATYQQTGDVVIIIPRWGTKAFDYHNHTDLPVHGLFETVTPDTDLEAMKPLIAGAERVWLVRYQVDGTDPANRAEAWMQSKGTLNTEVFPTAIQIKLYDLHPTVTTLPAQAVARDVQFGGLLRLRGYTLPVTSGPALETRLHPPSNWVQVTLYLEALKPLQNVTLRVRLVDPQGGVWGNVLERGADVLHRMPLATWQPNQMYDVPFDLNLNPETPIGLYRVEVMLLDANGAPLPASGANAGANWAFAGEYEVK